MRDVICDRELEKADDTTHEKGKHYKAFGI
jgi:hypothetical protein